MQDITRHLDDLAAGRWDDYKAAFATDVIYEEMATRTRVQGVDEYMAIIQRWKRAFPDLKATVLSTLESGDRTVAELEWEGTQSGPFESPFGTLPASDKKGRVRGVLIFRMKGDKIIESRHYFDLLTVLAQTGAVPALGATTQPSAQVTPPLKH